MKYLLVTIDLLWYIVLVISLWSSSLYCMESALHGSIIEDNCNWDSSKPISSFFSCIVVSRRHRVKRFYNERPGHPCHAYVRLKQPERRVGNKISHITGRALCDRTIRRMWYRFEGPAGGDMPTTCPDEMSCGTHAPVWLNGKHPTTYGEIVDREVCVSLAGHCCTRRWYIRVANCGDFYSYLLTSTPGCFMAYCAGDGTPCPEGQSSLTGYSPGCSDNFPPLDGKTHLTVGQEGHKVAFYCDYEGVIPVGAALEVNWFVQGDKSGLADAEKFSVYTDQMIERRRSVLTEGSWTGKMGSTVYCELQGKWKNETGVPSPLLQSNKYFAGIKIMKRLVEISESEKETEIQLQSTIPVTCLPQFNEACRVTVELAHEEDMEAKHCVDGDMRQVVFGDCSIDITPKNWKEVHNVSIKAVRDFYRDGNKRMKVNFRPIDSTLTSDIWKNYHLPDIEVVTKDVPTKMCASTGDPHYTTFDGLYYHVYLEGEFVMYKNTRLPIQINARLEQCGKTVSCNCAIAVKAADDVIVIDRCNRQKRNLAFGESFPEGWRTLHRHALEQGGEFVKGLKIYEYDDGRRYTVHLPTGAYIDFRVGEHWINVYLYASSDDWQSTLGLCGTFDGDKLNDWTHSDGFTTSFAKDNEACGDSPDLCKFAESWRVQDKDSFFGPVVEVDMKDHDFFRDEQYCKCEKKGTKTDVVCNYHYDVDNCQEREQTREGKEKTDDIMIKSRESMQSSHSRHRRSLDLQDAVDNYFSEQFVYNKSFIGQVPQWPTPSGITKRKARRHCADLILRTPAGKICSRVAYEKLSSTFEACLTDIKVTDNLEWAASAVSAFMSQCADEIHQESAFWKPNTETPSDDPNEDKHEKEANTTQGLVIGEIMLKQICPGDCSKQGTCKNGKCACEFGFGGVDCSVKILKPAEISHLSDGGMCDVRWNLCNKIIVYGTGFRNNPSLKCRFQLLFSSDEENSAEDITTHPIFETFEEIQCRLPSHDVTPKNPNSNNGSAYATYFLSVIQDGFASSKIALTVYDSHCQKCRQIGESIECVQKNDTCIINGYCFKTGEPNPDRCCESCSPLHSLSTFTGITDNKPPDIKPKGSTYHLTKGQAWGLDIEARDPEMCITNYGAYVAGGPGIFRIVISYSGVHIETREPVPGSYTIVATAADECGSKSSASYSVLVSEQDEVASNLDCTDTLHYLRTK